MDSKENRKRKKKTTKTRSRRKGPSRPCGTKWGSTYSYTLTLLLLNPDILFRVNKVRKSSKEKTNQFLAFPGGYGLYSVIIHQSGVTQLPIASLTPCSFFICHSLHLPGFSKSSADHGSSSLTKLSQPPLLRGSSDPCLPSS